MNKDAINIFIDACTTGIGIYSPELGWLYSQKISKETNNKAEWIALNTTLEFLNKIDSFTDEKVYIYTDSLLVVKQFNENYRVKDENLLIQFKQAKSVEMMLKINKNVNLTLLHIRGSENTHADKLSRGTYFKELMK